jgi:hypothetical protein
MHGTAAQLPALALQCAGDAQVDIATQPSCPGLHVSRTAALQRRSPI